MIPTQDSNATLAVLIDADNANPAIIAGLLEEIAKLGVASVKRIYGDWTTPNLGSWKQVLLKHSIQPIQQFSYTSGKNATDSAMIIDAMDLLYAKHFDGFCLVSSDSDFTRLASRIRESGLSVYGFGEKKTPRPFVAACDRFIYTEVFLQKPDEVQAAGFRRRNAKELRADNALINLLRNSIEAASEDSGWSQLGPVGSFITKTANDFDARTYGYAKLSSLLTATGLFEVERRDNRVYVRNPRQKAGDGDDKGRSESRTENRAEARSEDSVVADKASDNSTAKNGRSGEMGQEKSAERAAQNKQSKAGKGKQKNRSRNAATNASANTSLHATADTDASSTPANKETAEAREAATQSPATAPVTATEPAAAAPQAAPTTATMPVGNGSKGKRSGKNKREALVEAVAEAVMEAAASVAAASNEVSEVAAIKSGRKRTGKSATKLAESSTNDLMQTNVDQSTAPEKVTKSRKKKSSSVKEV